MLRTFDIKIVPFPIIKLLDGNSYMCAGLEFPLCAAIRPRNDAEAWIVKLLVIFKQQLTDFHGVGESDEVIRS